ncbi:conserved membrane hypothetical protein [Candidatus Desulfarcum epimagneticum]|uniref:Uncharacterized protein n=1 Tax=uncultured Desulfobacteraceae bacterium TaxID=218296 RepID=A0A484HJX7_9BACT|nr:conserved membrane hypothetical protein [uncultured Desulfobacteraceae bacterium]
MSGIQEILLILVIILMIVFVPRLVGGRREKTGRPFEKISGKTRLGIAVSVLNVAIFAVVFKPWGGQALFFTCFGLAPVAAGWGAWWVWVGFRKEK